MLGRASMFFGLAAVILASLLLLRLPAPTVDRLVVEDGPIESFGAAFLFVGAVALALALRSLRRSGASWLAVLTYAGCALFLFVAAGEEISWGQRLFGVQTPEPIVRSTHRAKSTCTTCTATSTPRTSR